MHASVVEIKLKPGTVTELVNFAEDLREELAQLEGLKELILIDKGNQDILGIVIYETAAQQQATTARAQEVLAGMAEFVAEPPVRKGCNVPLLLSF